MCCSNLRLFKQDLIKLLDTEIIGIILKHPVFLSVRWAVTVVAVKMHTELTDHAAVNSHEGIALRCCL